jgi:hypothetical protein
LTWKPAEPQHQTGARPRGTIKPTDCTHDDAGALRCGFVDTESHIAAGIAAAHQVPFVACRVVIDPANKRLPPAALVGLRPDGTADVRAVIHQPSQLPTLIRTALDAWTARAALYRGRRMLGARLGFPRFSDGVADVRASARGELQTCP